MDPNTIKIKLSELKNGLKDKNDKIKNICFFMLFYDV